VLCIVCLVEQTPEFGGGEVRSCWEVLGGRCMRRLCFCYVARVWERAGEDGGGGYGTC